jgi:CRP-like cAMP-binding protein
VTTEEKLELVRQFAVFKAVDEASLKNLVERAHELEFAQGQIIARAGQIGTGLFLILKGSVGVIRQAKEVDVSGPGDIVGEMSVLAHAPRIASLVAREPVVCLGIASWELDEILKTPGLSELITDIDREHRLIEQERLAREHEA